MSFEFFNESSQEAPDPFPIEKALDTVLAGEKRQASAMSVILLSNDDLRAMKATHFGLDVYTDVIAFNLNDPNEPVLEGEIYMSPEQIRENGEEYQVSFEQEFFRVLIHGCLHLCGYEDGTPEEKSRMQNRENLYLSELGLL